MHSALSPTPATATTRQVVLNIVLMQASWFVAVLAAARGHNWPGVLAVAIVVLCHLGAVRSARTELRLIGQVTALGLLIEILNAHLGGFHAQAALNAQWPAPWLVALWPLFATSLNVSLRWLRSRYLLAALLGAVAGPLAYASGAGLNALQFTDATWALLSLALIWSLAMPAMLWLAARSDGVAHAH